MVKLISKHMSKVPPVIYVLLQSVIKARTAAYSFFRRMTPDNQDPEVKKTNAGHKHFIDALKEVFTVLGGEKWAADAGDANQEPNAEDLAQLVFANKFATLNLGDEAQDGDEDEDEDQVDGPGTQQSQPRQRQQTRTKKGKGKKKGKSKKKRTATSTTKEADIQYLPLESYRIIEDTQGIITDYLVAVYELWKKFIQLRTVVLSVWSEVAYDGENSAVAGAMSQVAVAMARRAALDIIGLFLDRDTKRHGRGYMQGVFVLKQLLQRDGLKRGQLERHQHLAMWLDEISADFRDWLGETKYMYGLNTIPPSRFSHINANGLWEFSPYLCGVGLLRGLELAYLSGMMTWDQVPEIVPAVHLHNMLVMKGFIERAVGLFDSLAMLFPSQFFAGGEVPTANFSRALLAHVGDAQSRKARRRRRANRRTCRR